MPTIQQLAEHAGRDIQNHYQQFLTGQNAPMISPENAPADEAGYMSQSHTEISYRPGEAAPSAEAAPQGMTGETLAPEPEGGRWPSAFAKLAEHHVTDADYTDVTGQHQLTGPSHGQQHDTGPEQPHSSFGQEL